MVTYPTTTGPDLIDMRGDVDLAGAKQVIANLREQLGELASQISDRDLTINLQQAALDEVGEALVRMQLDRFQALAALRRIYGNAPPTLPDVVPQVGHLEHGVAMGRYEAGQIALETMTRIGAEPEGGL